MKPSLLFFFFFLVLLWGVVCETSETKNSLPKEVKKAPPKKHQTHNNRFDLQRMRAGKTNASFVYPPDLQPPPALDVSDEEWEMKMPKPLKADLQPWMDFFKKKKELGFPPLSTTFVESSNSSQVRGGTSSSSQQKGIPVCRCKEKSQPLQNRFLFYFKNGVFWFQEKAIKHTTGPKQRKFSKDLEILNSVASYLSKKYKKLPTVQLLNDYISIPSEAPCKCDPTFPPVLVLASKSGDVGFVRRPTMYLKPSWVVDVKKLYKAKLDWANKTQKACWRGLASVYPGGKARLDGLFLQEKWKKEKPEMAKYLDIGQPKDLSPYIKEWFKKELISESTRDDYLTIPKSESVPEKWFSTCKYNVHFPGEAHGGYSQELQSLLPQQTAALIWGSPHREYYYDWMEPGRDFLEVSPSNMEQVLRDLLDDDPKAEKIAENGLIIYERYLQWETILVYWEWLILSLIRYAEPVDIKLDQNWCSCQPAVPHQLCLFCNGDLRGWNHRW